VTLISVKDCVESPNCLPKVAKSHIKSRSQSPIFHHTNTHQSQVHGLILGLSHRISSSTVRSDLVNTSQEYNPLPGVVHAHFYPLETILTYRKSQFQRMRFLSCLWTHIRFHIPQLLIRRKEYGMNQQNQCGIVFGNLPRNPHLYKNVWNRFPRRDRHHKNSPKIRRYPKFHRIFRHRNPN
jgi:hypothetical protein